MVQFLGNRIISTAGRRALLGVLLAFAALLLLRSTPHALAGPPPAGTASGWTTAQLEHFHVQVQSADDSDAWSFAATYGNYLETAFTELTLILPEGAPAEPIALYVYTDAISYNAAALAVTRPEISTIIVTADTATRDLTLYLPSFQKLSEIEAENQLRHALSHVLTAVASDGKLPWGLEEGIAQYLERPINEKLARIASIMQSTAQTNSLLTWQDMNFPSATVDPNLAVAESYSVVAYLIDSYKLESLRAFLHELRTAETWTAAMRTAYGREQSSIERLWKEKLPKWTTSDWRNNLVAGFNLEPARALLDGANYVAAKTALDPARRLFVQLDAPDQLALIESMIEQCDVGIQAESLITQTQQALSLHTYDRAMNLLAQAKLQFAQLPESHQPTELIATYEQLATDGVVAGERLDTAIQLSHSWRDYPDARDAAVDAGTAYARLGDEAGVEKAKAVLDDLDKRQRRIVLMLAALAVVTLAWLALWLWSHGPTNLSWR